MYLLSKKKRLFDVATAAALLLVTLPVFIVLCCVIYLGGKQPIYSHYRVGLNGRVFKCFKFRTMVKDSQDVLESYLRQNPAAKKEWEENRKLVRDPRVTSVGRVLRRTSIDELPQLFNILLGQMSVVGPRPVTKEELSKYGNAVSSYLACKPGVAGLWQARGRGAVTYSRRVAHDVVYKKNASFCFDCRIIWETLICVFTGRGSV